MINSYQKVIPDYLPRKINRYVPAMQFAADVEEGKALVVDFGPVATLAAAGILNAQSAAAAVTVTSFLDDTANAPFGQNITIVLSGAGAGNVVVSGRDYLGQPMSEQITTNGATPVAGKKAFMWLDSIYIPTIGAVTANIGWGSQLGMPYKATAVLEEVAAGAKATSGTLTAPVLTDPQTNTTGDPRGTYAPNTAFDGVTDIVGVFLASAYVNASGNGGLYGVKHYSS